MSAKHYIDQLWREFRVAINSAYKKASQANDDGICLRDYAEDISWHDDLAALLGRETANERQHRSNRPSVPGFSNESAAKLIIMDNASKGAKLAEIPRATEFLILRQTAVESEVIGYLIRNELHESWHAAVNVLDYAKLMQPSRE